MNLLEALRCLTALEQHRHFGRAAQACRITQPAHPLVEPVVRTPIGFMTAASARATPALELAQDADWLRGLVRGRAP